MTTAVIHNWTIAKTCPVCGQSGACLERREERLVACVNIATGCLNDAYGAPARAGGAFIHKIKGKGGKRERMPMADLQETYVAGLTEAAMEGICERYNVSPKTIRDFGIGYSNDAYTVPVRNCRWTIHAFAILRPGKHVGWIEEAHESRNHGFFAPADPTTLESNRFFVQGGPVTLIIPRGLRTTLQAYEAGFIPLGRPTLATSPDAIVALTHRFMLDMVIVPDREGSTDKTWPGLEGALLLAQAIIQKGRQVRFMELPRRFQDGTPVLSLSDWLERGLDAAELVKAAPKADLKYVAQHLSEIAAKCS